MAMSPMDSWGGCHMCGNALTQSELEAIGWLARNALILSINDNNREELLSILAKTEVDEI